LNKAKRGPGAQAERVAWNKAMAKEAWKKANQFEVEPTESLAWT